MTYKIMAIFAVSFMLFTVGCDTGQFTQSKEIDDYTISVTHDPHPIRVGQTEKLYVTLRRERSGVSGCRVTLSKSQSGDPIFEDKKSENVDMPEGGRSGIYHAKGIVFSEVGEWELTFKVNCAGREREIDFPVVVTGA